MSAIGDKLVTNGGMGLNVTLMYEEGTLYGRRRYSSTSHVTSV